MVFWWWYDSPEPWTLRRWWNKRKQKHIRNESRRNYEAQKLAYQLDLDMRARYNIGGDDNTKNTNRLWMALKTLRIFGRKERRRRHMPLTVCFDVVMDVFEFLDEGTLLRLSATSRRFFRAVRRLAQKRPGINAPIPAICWVQVKDGRLTLQKPRKPRSKGILLNPPAAIIPAGYETPPAGTQIRSVYIKPNFLATENVLTFLHWLNANSTQYQLDICAEALAPTQKQKTPHKLNINNPNNILKSNVVVSELFSALKNSFQGPVHITITDGENVVGLKTALEISSVRNSSALFLLPKGNSAAPALCTQLDAIVDWLHEHYCRNHYLPKNVTGKVVEVITKRANKKLRLLEISFVHVDNLIVQQRFVRRLRSAIIEHFDEHRLDATASSESSTARNENFEHRCAAATNRSFGKNNTKNFLVVLQRMSRDALISDNNGRNPSSIFPFFELLSSRSKKTTSAVNSETGCSNVVKVLDAAVKEQEGHSEELLIAIDDHPTGDLTVYFWRRRAIVAPMASIEEDDEEEDGEEMEPAKKWVMRTAAFKCHQLRLCAAAAAEASATKSATFQPITPQKAHIWKA